MSGQGPYGPAGPTGITGMTGRRGRQGPPRGPTGLGFYSPIGYLPYTSVDITGDGTVAPTASTCGTYYVLTGGTTCYIQLPGTPPPTGGFWVFKNDVAGGGSPVIIGTLQGGTAQYYYGAADQTVINIASGNSLILAYSGSGTSYIVL